LATCNLPFSTVDLPGFKRFVQVTNPRYHVKCGKTMGGGKLDKVHENLIQDVTDELTRDLKDVEAITFTTDGWTAPNGDPFVSLSVQYITADFQLKCIALDIQNFNERHSAANI